MTNDRETQPDANLPPQTGTILRAANGDVIRYDASGLVLKLSNAVIEDINNRLPKPDPSTSSRASSIPSEQAYYNAEILGDIDAWNVRRDGEWYVFSARLPGQQGTRDFRRNVNGGDIFADTTGALFGLFSIGGARRAAATPGPGTFPYHVLAPSDDIGAVGVAGVEVAGIVKGLQQVPEQTRDACIAQSLLHQCFDTHRSLPTFVARCETDTSVTVQELASGQAYKNLLIAAQNLQNAAQSLDRPARILSIGIDYVLEDVLSDHDSYRDGVIELMNNLETDLAKMGFARPLFVTTFDCGTQEISDGPALRAQWELAWNNADHDLLFSAPGYMFPLDDTARPDPSTRLHMADMDAAAIETYLEGKPWTCPIFYLAERQEDKIRVTAGSIGDLVIDQDDPFSAGAGAGFRLQTEQGYVGISHVALCSEDPKCLLLTPEADVKDQPVTLLYALGAPPTTDGTLANRGAIRDDWQRISHSNRPLHRWALPCALPVH
ncbi:hypothetical protein [Roseovarius sp. EL26]|uniref:hypothetical protein n=1 Tax=Roseovarius sp. EL26 TaxID=2126672 RepID=UPI000EA025CC|nr:hypothetical protein [Roseovarius sp. EL26]